MALHDIFIAGFQNSRLEILLLQNSDNKLTSTLILVNKKAINEISQNSKFL